MKLVTASNNTKNLQISRAEWLRIGSIAGWTKTAQPDPRTPHVIDVGEVVKLAKELTAGSETARDALHSLGSSMKHLYSDLLKVREELREQGFDREADGIFLDAKRAFDDLKRVLLRAENL